MQITKVTMFPNREVKRALKLYWKEWETERELNAIRVPVD